jgi:hypothetical protein
MESTDKSSKKEKDKKIPPVQKKNPPRGFMWLKPRTPGKILVASPSLEEKIAPA